MNYFKVTIETTPLYGEVLADLLAAITGGCEVDDPQTVHQWAADGDSRWDYLGSELFENPERPVTVNFYAADDEAGQVILREVGQELVRLKAEPDAELWGSLAICITPMENQDWEISWRQYFKLTPIGARLLVRPSWEEIDNPEGRVVLTIDPSSSFGTGTHATTQMCLEALGDMNLAGRRVLDMGCGSGILACGALLLGADHALCCDIEQDAMTATAENMLRNGIAPERYATLQGNVLSDMAFAKQLAGEGPFGVVTANIVADVLIAMAGLLKKLVAPGGTLMLSGILSERRAEVTAAFQQVGFAEKQTLEREGWSALVMEHTVIN